MNDLEDGAMAAGFKKPKRSNNNSSLRQQDLLEDLVGFKNLNGNLMLEQNDLEMTALGMYPDNSVMMPAIQKDQRKNDVTVDLLNTDDIVNTEEEEKRSILPKNEGKKA